MLSFLGKDRFMGKQGDGNFNHVSHYEYKYVQVLHIKVLYILYISFIRLQGMGSNSIFYKIHPNSRTVHTNMPNLMLYFYYS